MQLYEWALVFAHPSELLIKIEKDFKVNGISIFKEINEALENYEKKDMYDTGYDLGEAFSNVFLGDHTLAPNPFGAEK